MPVQPAPSILYSKLGDHQPGSLGDESFRLLFEHSLDAIVIADDVGRYVEVNSAACMLLGYTRDQLLTMNVADLATAAEPPAGELYRAYLVKTQESGEFSFIRPDGEAKTAEYSACRIANGLNLSILRDTTERRRAVAEIASLNARLHRAVIESSHRIKNHLQTITATLDIAVGDHVDSVPVPDLQRVSNQIRALSVIHDLLTASSKKDALAAVISTGALLERVLGMLGQASEGKRLTYEIEDAPLPVRKSSPLCLALNELVSNAFKHGKSSANVRFTVTGETGELVVSDDGPGFSDDFDPKTAAHTGLQLLDALVHWDLGGQIEFSNQPVGGGRVTVTIQL